MILQAENDKIERGSTSGEIDKENTNLEFEGTEQIKPSNDIQCSCDELKIHKKDLKREKQKILRYLFYIVFCMQFI